MICLKPHSWKVAVPSQAQDSKPSAHSGPCELLTNRTGQYGCQIAPISGKDLEDLGTCLSRGTKCGASCHQHASSLWSQQTAAPLLTAAEI